MRFGAFSLVPISHLAITGLFHFLFLLRQTVWRAKSFSYAGGGEWGIGDKSFCLLDILQIKYMSVNIQKRAERQSLMFPPHLLPTF
ncbi:MAG: hypothetical protein BHW19_08490 [Eubacterium sp. 38_16]|jgi:hypothetical protein|nr:MAG: hypothetical protein BHW19_08490 [Eubacterium sp. 38_16]